MNKKKKFIEIVRDFMFNIEKYNPSQLQNYFIVLVCAMLIKIFFLLQISGETFITSFEICVWVFMTVWLMLRALHSFNLLQGYYLLSSVFLLVFIIVRDGYWLVNVSIGIIIVCKVIEIKDIIFAKGRKQE